MNKKFDKNGLPLKIKTEWTNDTYHYRKSKYSDDLQAETIEGWLVRINGIKFPRAKWTEDHLSLDSDSDGNLLDYSYRYTPAEGKTEYGKQIAISNAIKDYELEIVK